MDVAAPEMRSWPSRLLGVDGDAGVSIVAVFCKRPRRFRCLFVRTAQLVAIISADINIEVWRQIVSGRIMLVQ